MILTVNMHCFYSMIPNAFGASPDLSFFLHHQAKSSPFVPMKYQNVIGTVDYNWICKEQSFFLFYHSHDLFLTLTKSNLQIQYSPDVVKRNNFKNSVECWKTFTEHEPRFQRSVNSLLVVSVVVLKIGPGLQTTFWMSLCHLGIDCPFYLVLSQSQRALWILFQNRSRLQLHGITKLPVNCQPALISRL